MVSMFSLGWIDSLSGDLDQASRWHEEMLSLAQSLGEARYRSIALASVGADCWIQGEVQRAKRLLDEGLGLAAAGQDSIIGAQCLEVLAWIAPSDSDLTRAVSLMAAAAAITTAVGCAEFSFWGKAESHEECVRHARDRLGAADYAIAWDNGTAMTFEEAVALAVD